ncbi:MAG: helix-turn-helix transcriptional regulator [Clostridiales bacterium]|nr:helix-turn-helix transcriptional regulator [Clostridiales bacterium]
MERLGETIKDLRIEKGYTQPQLAKLVGVSNGIISIWENNINEPKATYIKRLATIFGVSADYLLGINENDLN